MWAFLSRNQAIGQLLLRLWLGGFFLYVHGWKKLAGGIETWRALGGAVKLFGIHFWLPFWGFMATMAETLCVVLFIIGFAFRPACLIIAITMAVASYSVYHEGSLEKAAHPIELGIVFFTFIFIGPGKYSVDKQ